MLEVLEVGLSGCGIRRLKLTGARPSFSNVRHGSTAISLYDFRYNNCTLGNSRPTYHVLRDSKGPRDQGEICIAFMLLLG